jgi:hypothetical protein
MNIFSVRQKSWAEADDADVSRPWADSTAARARHASLLLKTVLIASSQTVIFCGYLI